MWTDDDGEDIDFLDDSIVDLVADGNPARDDIDFLDDSVVELIEDEPSRPAYRRSPLLDLEDADTRVWIRPYAARRSLALPRPRLLATRPHGRYTGQPLR